MVTEREKRITENMALVHMVAGRFRSRGADYDDVFQAGCVGLIKAADNFDESRGFRFSTYAVPMIMGEIRQLFRDDQPVKLSRSMKDKSYAVQTIRERFLDKEQREPTLSELSELSGLEAEELCEVLNAAAPVLSLTADSDNEENVDIPFDESEQMMDRLLVDELTKKLSPREQLIIRYRFYQGKTQSEVAKLLGISQVQVSRCEKRALQKMREGSLNG